MRKSKALRIGKRLLIVLFSLYALICVLVYFFQEHLLFHPTVLQANHQFQFNLPFEERDFKIDEETTLNALHFKRDSSKGLVLYFHGNSGSLEGWGGVAEDVLRFGYDLLVFDYPGYGKSTGKLSEIELREQGVWLYEEMEKEYNHLVLYGRSLGTGIATYVALNKEPEKLILETPYYSMTDVASTHYPYLPTFILRYPIRTDLWLPKVKCPILLIHGTKDEVVYYGSSEKLKELVPQVELVTIHGGNHNNLDDYALFHTSIDSFLND